MLKNTGFETIQLLTHNKESKSMREITYTSNEAGNLMSSLQGKKAELFFQVEHVP